MNVQTGDPLRRRHQRWRPVRRPVYAAYGGVYVGVAVSLAGMAIIMFGRRPE